MALANPRREAAHSQKAPLFAKKEAQGSGRMTDFVAAGIQMRRRKVNFALSYTTVRRAALAKSPAFCER